MKFLALSLCLLSGAALERRTRQGTLLSSVAQDKALRGRACFVPDRCVKVDVLELPKFHFDGDNANMTPAVCHGFCAAKQTMYFGIKAGGSCWCADGYQEFFGAGPSLCDMPCPGDSAQVCGGVDDSSVWIAGAGCAEAAEAATTPESEERATETFPKYMGCFVDDDKRDLDFGPGTGGSNTTACGVACKRLGYRYMGLQKGGECRCGRSFNTEGAYKKAEDSECGDICDGEEGYEPTRYCGGEWRSAIYGLY